MVDTRKQYALGLEQALKQTYPEGYPTDFQTRFLRHHEKLWVEYDARRLAMADLRRQRFIRAWQDYGVARSESEADAFYATYTATLDATLVAYPRIAELIGTLGQSYRLGIITNGAPDLQWRKLGIAGLRDFFPREWLIISEEIGKAKPDPSVFQHACAQLQVAPGDALMVGDNYDKDVLGARVFGMDALWLVPDPEMAAECNRMGVQDHVIAEPLDLITEIRRLERHRS